MIPRYARDKLWALLLSAKNRRSTAGTAAVRTMDDRALTALYEKLLRIVTEGVAGRQTSERFTQVNWDSPRFGFAHGRRTTVDETIDDTAKRLPGVSRQLVDNMIGNCLSILHREGKSDKSFSEIRRIIEGAAAAVRHYTVFVPIVGITTACEEIQLGPASVVKLSASDIQRFLRAIDEEEIAAHAFEQSTDGQFQASPTYLQLKMMTPCCPR